MAPIFTDDQHAPADQNQLTMEKMKLLASHYGLVCLQHEKPFESINGVGQAQQLVHLRRWPANLLDPGENPMENAALPRIPHRRYRGGGRVSGASAHVGGVRRQRPPSRRQRGAAGHRVHVPRRRAGRDRGGAHRRSRLHLGRARIHGSRRGRAAELHQGQHRPQPHEPLCLHGQQVRVPYARQSPRTCRM